MVRVLKPTYKECLSCSYWDEGTGCMNTPIARCSSWAEAKQTVLPMRIYVAGALSSKERVDRDPTKVVTDYIQNVHAMCQAASVVRKKGHIPYIPCLDFFIGLIAGDWEEEDYRRLGMEFLDTCDAILVISNSTEVSAEEARAKLLGLEIYYFLEDVPDIIP